MKKINIFFIILTIVLSFIVVFSELDRGIVIVLKDSSIIFTLVLPYIIKRLFKVNIGEGFIFVWILFIFLAHYMGVICEMYNKWYYFDKVTHTFSGVLSGCAGVVILSNVKVKSIGFKILFILSFTWLCAGLWEVFEFTCNALFGGDAQRVALTGVTDTMWDMIVAFIGSIFVCIFYYIKEKYSALGN